MKKIILCLFVISLLLPISLTARVTYLTDAEYKKLSKSERTQYWQNLENEMKILQDRRSKAQAELDQNNTDIKNMEARMTAVDAEIQALYVKLGITDEKLQDLHSKLQYYKDQLANWEKMSDSQLWENAKAFKELSDSYEANKQLNYAKLPEFKRDFTDLDRRFSAINNSMKNKKAQGGSYYEDSYVVQKGESLSKISGYEHIYGDTKKWGIIYRANRDQIKDPNIIETGMDLKIPRGLPGTWKVYKGESLWKIAAYPEVYGKGSKWTIIYRANKDQIKDPDLIYPNQTFTIPRD